MQTSVIARHAFMQIIQHMVSDSSTLLSFCNDEGVLKSPDVTDEVARVEC